MIIRPMRKYLTNGLLLLVSLTKSSLFFFSPSFIVGVSHLIRVSKHSHGFRRS